MPESQTQKLSTIAVPDTKVITVPGTKFTRPSMSKPLGGMLLLTLGEREPVDIQTLVAALGRDKSQISRVIQRFERLGLLQRKKSDVDGRVSVLRLTAMGREQLTKIQEALAAVVQGIFNGLSRRERAEFAKLLTRVLAEPPSSV